MKVTFILKSQSCRLNTGRKGQERKRILSMCFPSYLWPHGSSKPWWEAELLSKVFSPWQQGWWLAQLVTGRAVLDGASDCWHPSQMLLPLGWHSELITNELGRPVNECGLVQLKLSLSSVLLSFIQAPLGLLARTVSATGHNHPAPVCTSLQAAVAHFPLKLGKFKSLLKVPLFTEQM